MLCTFTKGIIRLITRPFCVPVIAATCLLFAATESVSAQPTIERVDGVHGLTIAQGATGNDWSHAYKHLRDALNVIDTPTSEVQVWVTAGTYRPDEYTAPAPPYPNGDNDRNKSFVMKNNIRLYGGFLGNSAQSPAVPETTLNERKPFVNITILSGDLNNDDDPDDPFDPNLIEDNSHHVVRAVRVQPSARIDGFTIKSGNATDDESDADPTGYEVPGAYGAGMIMIGDPGGLGASCSPVVLRCTFKHNIAMCGGAVECAVGGESVPNFQLCEFRANRVTNVGGAVHKIIAEEREDPCSSASGNPTFASCLFTGNEAGGGGEDDGYAIFGEPNGNMTLYNCTIANNPDGGLLYFASVTNECDYADIYNCIFYFNGDGSIEMQVYGAFCMRNSCMQNGPINTGICIGNINDDPDFVNEPNNHRLNANSPCVNTGNSTEVPNDAYDLFQRGVVGPVMPDLQFLKRIVGDDVDMGAYEVQTTAACKPEDVSPQPSGDGTVGIADLLYVIAHWGPCPSEAGCPADVAPFYGVVDVKDLLAVIAEWGACMMPSQLPESLGDCYDLADETCEESEDPDCWFRIYSGCVDYLCQEDIISCD